MNNSYSECASCQRKFDGQETAFAGYIGDQPAYVGVYCADALTENASPVYWWWSRDGARVATSRFGATWSGSSSNAWSSPAGYG